MSSFIDKARHPETGVTEDAEYLDDYYGRHRYGVRFSDGKVFPIKDVVKAEVARVVEISRKHVQVKYASQEDMDAAIIRELNDESLL